MVSYKDWVNTTFSISSSAVPDSCCVYDVVGCGRGILNLDIHQVDTKIHVSGCLDTLSNGVKDNVAIVGGTIIGIAFVQVQIALAQYLVIFHILVCRAGVLSMFVY